MPFLLTCTYRPGGDVERLAIRDIHLEYMIANRDAILYGGALLSADGARTIGMMIVLAVEDPEAVRRFLAAEPYTSHGLFERIERDRVRQFIPSDDPQLLVNELERERQRGA